ncbi:MAG: c-type cytochrome biogenesis protein CcmI, partial [Hyphomicrobiales bacterium]|nr:c-type cytochrome biogenesis protein CcmI [Hyphomicrobiales bacterium]
YRRALALLGENAALRADLGETLMASRPGEVTPEALAEFRKAAAEGTSDNAEYYLGLAAVQAGDKAEAIRRFTDVRDRAAAGSDLRLRMEAEIARLNGAPPASALAGASSEELKAIRGMVAGLAARLDSSPADVEGWLRLVRAYSVLGEADAARAALAKAHKQFAGDPASDGRLSALAAELKL